MAHAAAYAALTRNILILASDHNNLIEVIKAAARNKGSSISLSTASQSTSVTAEKMIAAYNALVTVGYTPNSKPVQYNTISGSMMDSFISQAKAAYAKVFGKP